MPGMAQQPIVLSHLQTGPLVQARQAGKATAAVSPDLGLTVVEAALEPEGVRFPGGQGVASSPSQGED